MAWTVWGSNPYATASDACQAAIHSGFIGLKGGEYFFQEIGYVDSFEGSIKNNITT